MTTLTFEQLLTEAVNRPITGWDFSWLGSRIIADREGWNFTDIVVSHTRNSPDLLDLGTGGGEWLASLPNRPHGTVATESWALNVRIAEARLQPIGITVVRTEAAPENNLQLKAETRGPLPFRAESFSLVVSRREAFVASEVARILKPRGTFLTEQVGGNYDDFYDALGLPRPVRTAQAWDLQLAIDQLSEAGLRIAESGQGIHRISFADVGAFAWYLSAVSWVVDGFSIDTFRTQLQRVHNRIRREGPIKARLPAFWLEAVKPGDDFE